MYRIEVTNPLGNSVIRMDTRDWDDMAILWALAQEKFRWNIRSTNMSISRRYELSEPDKGTSFVYDVGSAGQFRDGWTGTLTVTHIDPESGGQR